MQSGIAEEISIRHSPKHVIKCPEKNASVSSQRPHDAQYAISVMPMVLKAWRRPCSFSATTTLICATKLNMQAAKINGPSTWPRTDTVAMVGCANFIRPMFQVS